MTVTAALDQWQSENPSVALMLASKALVDDLLRRNIDNRGIRESHVHFLEEQIERGAYVLTNQGIGLDVDGRLIDGQHRLLAIRAQGYPAVPLLVVYGLPVAARAAIDIGLNRTVTDLMHFAFGHPETTSRMVAITRAWGTFCHDNTKRIGKVSANEICDWYLLVRVALERVLAVPGSNRVHAPSLAAILHRIHRFPDDPRPLIFLEQLISGANLAENSPALKLYRWLQSYRGSGSKGAHERFERTVSALSAFLEERTLDKLYRRQNPREILSQPKVR